MSGSEDSVPSLEVEAKLEDLLQGLDPVLSLLWVVL